MQTPTHKNSNSKAIIWGISIVFAVVVIFALVSVFTQNTSNKYNQENTTQQKVETPSKPDASVTEEVKSESRTGEEKPFDPHLRLKKMTDLNENVTEFQN